MNPKGLREPQTCHLSFSSIYGSIPVNLVTFL